MWILVAMMDNAVADDNVPRDRLWYTNSSFLRANPIGLVNAYRVGWRRRVSDAGGLLWTDTYTFLAGGAVVTPTSAKIGVFAEAQPIAMLRVFADVGFVGYYGTLDQVMSWSDPAARFSDKTLNELGKAGEHAPTTGTYITVGGTGRAKAGPIAIRNTSTFSQLDLELPIGDSWFYDLVTDRLVPNGGFVVVNDLDVLAVLGEVRAGLRYSFSDNLDGGTGTDGAMSQHRAGALLAWQFADHPPGALLNQPTLIVGLGWHLVHPYRTGEEQPAALPMFVLGFSFNGDLVDSRPSPVQ